MTHIQVWTPSGPKHTDLLSATLTPLGRHFVDLLSVDLDLLFQVKLEIDPKYCVFGLAKSRRRKIIPTMRLDAYC